MKFSKVLNKMAAVAVCAMSFASASAYAVPAFDVDPFSVFGAADSSNYSFAVDFTANQAITVDALAFFFNTADVAGSHAVALFDMNGNKLAETIVDTADALVGHFRYSSIAAVNLIAGTSYRIVGLGNDGEFAASQDVNVNSGISFLQAGVGDDSNNTSPDFNPAGLSWGNAGDPTDAFWGASFSFVPTRAEVPEPATYALFFAGLGLLLITRRRKSN
ncbi:DUF4082 domain-containing protein [Undibacterium sp. TJN25]|uniref:DUF4082 domain-containing protein n=1 Tax=Undibacterium sp. TJN25 TaxID=3413056 RepID=UPI003BF1D338